MIDILLTSFLICIGAIVISISISRSARLLKLLESESHQKRWRLLYLLQIIFIGAYAVSLFLLFSGDGKNLAILGGVLFLFASMFIYGMVQFTASSLKELIEGKAALKQNNFYDALTGLPNKALFTEHLLREISRAKRVKSYNFALLYMDLIHFNKINDSAGYETGNKVLQETAARIRAHLRKNDIAARFGSDEFGMLLSDIRGTQDVVSIVRRIKQSLDYPLAVDGKNITTSMSIGVVVNPVQYSHQDDVFRDAEMAMHQARQKTDSEAISILDENLQVLALVDHEVEKELKEALQKKEFILYFQPIIDPITKSVISAEALIRWHHPVKGIQPPMHFLATARSSGLLVELGYWILQEAAQKALQLSELLNRPCPISLNISSVQFHQEDFARKVLSILEEASVDPSLIRMEISENILLDQTRGNRAKINQLNSEGIEFSIDNFGTGLTSPAGLGEYPVDTVKIDRSFIKDITRNAKALSLVQGCFELAQANRLQIIAEGVETKEQLQTLQNIGQMQFQGYYFSKPANFTEFKGFAISSRVAELL